MFSSLKITIGLCSARNVKNERFNYMKEKDNCKKGQMIKDILMHNWLVCQKVGKHYEKKAYDENHANMMVFS